jgi:hypothetical protein
LRPVAAIGAGRAAISGVIIRIGTRTKTPASGKASAFLVFNLPEQPLAKLRNNWALTSFFVAASFLMAMTLSVMVQAAV